MGTRMGKLLRVWCGGPLLGLLMALLLAGCNLPFSVAGAGPRAWIDYPADGMTFSNGLVVVQSHSTGPNAISQVELYVNEVLARTDLNSNSAAGLVPMSQPWVPPGEGTYTLEVQARDARGNIGHSLPVHITVGSSLPPPASAPTAELGVTASPNAAPSAASPGPAACVEPSATLTLNGNCRAGPGTSFDPPVDVLLAGTSVRIVGRTEDSSWWQVQRPGGGTCWLSAVAVTTCGPVQGVAVIAPPPPPAAPPPPAPPPAASKPAAPGKLSVTKHVCAGSTYSVTLGWNDVADNEDGYRVYRGKDLLATLGADAAGYSDNPPAGGPYTYRVESFNGTGASGATTQDSGCIF